VAALKNPLFTLTAADVMTRDVVSIPTKLSVRGAAHRLLRAQISGAPVVDPDGRCVGVLSAIDLMRWVEEGPPPPPAAGASPWQLGALADVPVQTVADHMTADLVTATPDMSLGELARRMLDARVHRMVVLDEEGRPVGIITSTDLLAVLARYAASEGA
jgi:CBS-domain-containing membrane protein